VAEVKATINTGQKGLSEVEARCNRRSLFPVVERSRN
jgi:hypothetical protein